MNADSVVTALRKHVAERRAVINARFPKHLKRREYQKLVGEHEELSKLETVLQEAIRKANDPEPEEEAV